MENIQPVDDYSCLNHEYVSREDALRALEDYIRRRRYQMPMPDDLEEFILDGLEWQLHEGAIGWHDCKGAPKKTYSFMDRLLFWYLFYMHEWPKNSDLKGDFDTQAKYERVSDYAIKRNTDKEGLSPSSIKRIVRNFRDHGFKEITNPYSSLTQEHVRAFWVHRARLFCLHELKLDQAKAKEVALAIVEKWEEGQKV